jgi:outer membrane immunogenic protein
VVVSSWTGFYIGVQGGVADHHGSFYDRNGFFNGGTPPFHKFGEDKTSGTFGVNAGYNLPSGNLVYGIEGDWSDLGGRARRVDFNPLRCFPVNGCPFTTTVNVSWIATARARLGVAFDATLLYVTGGVAFGRVSNNFNFVIFNAPPLGVFNESTTKVGWVAGGGVERKLDRNWTIRAEGRYVDLGTRTVGCLNAAGTAPCSALTYRGEFRNSVLMGLAAVDFKF